MKRIEFVDWTRGIAAFMVLIQHTFERISPRFEVWTNAHLNFGISGVVAFFLISGYIISHTGKGKPAKVFLLNRLFRIFPLYLTLMVLGIVSSLAFLHDVPVNPGTLLANVLLVQDYVGFPTYVGGAWTLTLELAFYSMFILWGALGFFRKRLASALLLAAAMASLIALGVVSGHRVPLGRPLLVVTAFLSATLYFREDEPVMGPWPWIETATILLSLLWFALFIGNEHFSSVCLIVSWVCGYTLFFALKAFGAPAFLRPILSFMGQVSYSAYLLQGLSFSWLKHLGVTGPMLLIAMPCVYLAAFLLYRAVEKPGVEAGRKLSRALGWSLPRAAASQEP